MEDDKPGIALIGAGALGTALARRLAEEGYTIEAVFSRTPASARTLAQKVGAPVASAKLADLPGPVTLVFCCVPDDAVGGVARVLGRVPLAVDRLQCERLLVGQKF